MNRVCDERILYLSLFTVLYSKRIELYVAFKENLEQCIEELTGKTLNAMALLILSEKEKMEPEDREYWVEIFRKINYELIDRYQKRTQKGGKTPDKRFD